MNRKQTKVLIVAGEASGDAHAARLIKALNELGGDFRYFGSAGPQMRAAGVEPIVKADDLSVVGLAEIGRALPMFVGVMRKLRAAARDEMPDVAVLVDFPEFNLKLAPYLKKLGIKVVYYISPQLWAWRQYRISTIKKSVDLLITILPFEKAWYEQRGVPHVVYVGNPLAREVYAGRSREEFRSSLGMDPERPLIALLPGSRGKEISRILPTMLKTAGAMEDVEFVVALNKKLSKAYTLPQNVRSVVNATYDAVAASDAAAVTSGTATLETAILGTPMVVVYRTSKLNYKIFEPIIDVPHYALINLIAEERLATELIQDEMNAASLEQELRRLLEPDTNLEMRHALAAASAKLRKGGASKRAAEAVINLIQD